MAKILMGTIIDVNAREYTCTVRAWEAESNRSYELEDIAFLSTSAAFDIHAGTTDIPERFSPCLVLWTERESYLLHILPAHGNLINIDRNIEGIDINESITKTANTEYNPQYHTEVPQQPERHFERKSLIGARSHRPHDSIAGDKMLKTRDGSFFGVLRGGLIISKVSEFCQLVLNKVDNLFRLISRNIQVFTDWGRIDIYNSQNATNMSMHVGEGYSNNKQEKFTVHLDVGAVGNLIHLRVTDPEGVQQARVQVFPNGRIEGDSIHSVRITKGLSELHLEQNGDVIFKSEGNLFIN